MQSIVKQTRVALVCSLSFIPLLAPHSYAQTLVEAQSSSAIAEETTPLSLSSVILFAMDENPDLLIAHERVEQMENFKNEARSDYYPQINMALKGGREFIDPTSGDNNNNTGAATLTLNQKLFNGYSTSSEVKRRDRMVNSTLYSSDRQQEKIMLDTTTYYLDVLRYQAETGTVEKFVRELDSLVETIAQKFEAGDLSKTMYDYARSRQASAYADLSETNSSLNDAISNLEFLTGKLPPFEAVEPDMLRPEKFDIEFYVKHARENNTGVRQNLTELEAMKHQLNVEKGADYPQLNLNVKAEETHNDGGEVGRSRNLKATVNMSYNIFDGFNKKHRKDRVRSQIRELEHKDTKIVKELRKDIKLAYNQIMAIQDSVKAVNYEIKSNLAVQALNKENFRYGTINVIELIEGEERLKEAYLKLHGLKNSMYLNAYTLLINSAILENEYFCESCDDVWDEYTAYER